MIKDHELAAQRAEQHTFKPGADDFKCAQCGKPRALHAHDGFRPGGREFVTMDEHVRYTTPRSRRDESMPQI